MANPIKGITVEIGSDTIKLQNALKSVNSKTLPMPSVPPRRIKYIRSTNFALL